MIKNIIFDMGQVLIHFNVADISQKAGVPDAELTLFIQEVFHSVEWVQLDRGILSFEDAVSSIKRRLPAELHGSLEKIIFSWWEWYLMPMEGMEELIGEFKAKGYGIYLLSNATEKCRGYFDKIPGSQYFDGKIISAEWKLLKPEHEIYETLFQEYHLKPEECLFVDDLNINIEAALKAGMSGVLFRGNADRLRQELGSIL